MKFYWVEIWDQDCCHAQFEAALEVCIGECAGWPQRNPLIGETIAYHSDITCPCGCIGDDENGCLIVLMFSPNDDVGQSDVSEN